MKYLPNRLSLLLKSQGITQKKLAQLTDTTEAVISKYVNGSCDPKSSILAKIALVLNCSTDYLLGLSNTLSEDEITQEIKTIQRVRRNLSPKDRAKMDTMLKLSFLSIEEAFKDDDEN